MLEDVVATASLWTSVAEWFTPTVFFVLLNVVIGTIAVTSKASHGHSSVGVKSGAEAHHYPNGISGTDDPHNQLFHDAAPARQLSRTGSMLQRLKSFNLNFHMYRNRHEDYGVVAAAVPDVVSADARVTVEERVETPKRPVVQKNPKQQPLRRDLSPPAAQPRQIPQQNQPQQQQRLSRDQDEALNAAEFETLEEAFLAASGGGEHHHLERNQSDTHPTAGETTRKLASTMKKSASTKSAFAHFEARDLPKRPATTREDRRQRLEATVDEEDEDVEQIITAATAGRRSASGTGQQQQGQYEEVDARADDFINRFRNQLKLQRLESLMRYKDMLNRGGR